MAWMDEWDGQSDDRRVHVGWMGIDCNKFRNCCRHNNSHRIRHIPPITRLELCQNDCADRPQGEKQATRGRGSGDNHPIGLKALFTRKDMQRTSVRIVQLRLAGLEERKKPWNAGRSCVAVSETSSRYGVVHYWYWLRF